MSSNTALILELRQKIGSLGLSEKEMWKAPHFENGVARGIVAELIGHAKIEWLIELFKMHPHELIFWVKSDGHANPVALSQNGIKLERIKFVKCSADLQQVLRLALDCQQYPFIVAPNPFKEIRIFQRLHLLAEKSKSTVFLLGKDKLSQAWPISLQLEINKPYEFEITIHRQKHGVCE